MSSNTTVMMVHTASENTMNIRPRQSNPRGALQSLANPHAWITLGYRILIRSNPSRFRCAAAVAVGPSTKSPWTSQESCRCCYLGCWSQPRQCDQTCPQDQANSRFSSPLSRWTTLLRSQKPLGHPRRRGGGGGEPWVYDGHCPAGESLSDDFFVHLDHNESIRDSTSDSLFQVGRTKPRTKRKWSPQSTGILLGFEDELPPRVFLTGSKSTFWSCDRVDKSQLYFPRVSWSLWLNQPFISLF